MSFSRAMRTGLLLITSVTIFFVHCSTDPAGTQTCSSDSDCDTGYVCKSSQCTQQDSEANQEPTSAKEPGLQDASTPIERSPGCPASCSTDDDCKSCAGYTKCGDTPAGRICIEGTPPPKCPSNCSSDSDCSSCDGERTTCLAGSPRVCGKKPPPQCPSQCQSDSDCKSCSQDQQQCVQGTCGTTANQCPSGCRTARQCRSCPQGQQQCIQGKCGGDTNQCPSTCQSDRDCSNCSQGQQQCVQGKCGSSAPQCPASCNTNSDCKPCAQGQQECVQGKCGSAAPTGNSFFIKDALVHVVFTKATTKKTPVIMIPGLNLSSYIYVATPDGRTGWAQRFAAKGHDVYVINDPNFDWTKGFGVSPFTVPTAGAPPANPSATRAWQQDIWRRWGFGSSKGQPYPDTRFPTKDFAKFEAGYPFVGKLRRSYPDAVIALLDKIGSAVLLAHSAGGPTALKAALARPKLVPTLVLVEPTGPPTAKDFPALAGKSMLGVYGDYISSRNQTSRKTGTEAAAALFNQNNGVGKVISLPEQQNVKGNTHLLMQDNNSDNIADQIISWLASPSK